MISASTTEDNSLFSLATGYHVGEDFRGIKLVDSTNKILAMCGFDYWAPNAAQIHIWLPARLGLRSKSFFKELFKYIFVSSDKGVVIGCIPESNPACIKFTQGMGFKEIFRIKDGWDIGQDMVVNEMRRENCKWIDEEYRKQNEHIRNTAGPV